MADSSPDDRPDDRPVEVVAFDVNETLSDMSVMAQRFADVGADGGLAGTWFAGLLRDGIALAAAGASERFATIARESLHVLLDGLGIGIDTDKAVDHVLEGFAGLDVHPDVPGGVQAMAKAGVRMVTLSNGAAAVAEGLLGRAGIRDAFDSLLSVEDAGVWKPSAAAYEYAARHCGVARDRMLLVAVHPWDIDGASRAGMQTAWVSRDGGRYPGYFRAPDRTVTGLGDLAAQLTDTRGVS
jgi:2-haloacid dehalogenase